MRGPPRIPAGDERHGGGVPDWIVRTTHALADGLQSAWMLDPTIDMAAEIERFLVLLHP